MINEIIEVILELLLRIFVETFFFYTGEILLFILTFGKKKPRWNYYNDASASKFVIFTEISVWIGMAFWVFVFWFINSFLGVL
jgi:hypothetical protein